MKRESGQERRDVRHAGAADRIYCHRARGEGGGARVGEVDAPFDRGDRAHVLGSGHDAARPDGEHPGAAEVSRVVVIERADGGVGRTAVIIEDQARERVVAKEIEVRVAVERDDVRRGDLARDRVRRGAHVHRGAIEDEAVGRDGGGRNDRAGRGGDEVDGTAVNHRTAGVGGQGVRQVDGATRSGQHETDGGVGAADRIVDDARVERHRVQAIEEVEVARRGRGGATSGQAAAIDGASERVVVIGADEAAADEIKNVGSIREVEALGSAREAQGVDGRGTRGDRRAPGQTHVARRSTATRQVGRRVARPVVAQHHEARADNVGEEIGIVDRPAADDAVGESRAAFEGRGLGADITDTRATEGGVGLQDEGCR